MLYDTHTRTQDLTAHLDLKWEVQVAGKEFCWSSIPTKKKTSSIVSSVDLLCKYLLTSYLINFIAQDLGLWAH